MLENNAGQLNDQNDDENVNSSLGNAEKDQQNYSSDNDEMDDTQETASQDDENDGTKKQSATNVADKNRNIASSYHDNHRVTSRANEANDRLDSGSGGLSSGGVKSATDY